MIKQVMDWIITKVLVGIIIAFVGMLLLPYLLYMAWVRIVAIRRTYETAYNKTMKETMELKEPHRFMVLWNMFFGR